MVNSVLAVLSKMFNLAELWGLRQEGSSPRRLIRKFREKAKERYLSPDELARLSSVFDQELAAGKESPFVVAAFRLLILTGCRHSEIQRLKWSEVQGRILVLEDSKTGPRRIPLPDEALDILDGLGHPLRGRCVLDRSWS